MEKYTNEELEIFLANAFKKIKKLRRENRDLLNIIEFNKRKNPLIAALSNFKNVIENTEQIKNYEALRGVIKKAKKAFNKEINDIAR
jgi:hypothetical protein